MQNDLSDFLARAHARLAARLAARPTREIVLARLDHRSRFRGLVLAAAAILGAGIAFAQLIALEPAAINWEGPQGASFAIALLAVAGTIGALGRAVAD